METFVPQMTLTGSDDCCKGSELIMEDEEERGGIEFCDSVNTRLRMGDDKESCKSLRACLLRGASSSRDEEGFLRASDWWPVEEE